MSTTETTPVETPFSARIREATMAAHRDAERSSFVHRLMRGTLPIEGVADLMVQHHAIYRALEGTGEALADDPVAGAFLGPELARVPRIEADLRTLVGDDWGTRFEVRPATAEYVAAIAATAVHPERFVAQHYTRIMGDLSGGQMIRRTLERHYGEQVEGALSFYDFDIDDMDAYKDAYRTRLDTAPWTESERLAFLEETNRAYASNESVFGELDRAWPGSDPDAAVGPDATG
jgi:heme oxygenase